MNFEYNDKQKALWTEMVDFATENLNQEVEERDRAERFDRHLWEKCGAIGLPGLMVSKEFGGRGLDPLSMVIALEALGYGCRDNGLSFAIGAHLLACVFPIWKFGSKEQQGKHLPNLCNGTWIAANAITETNSGSDVFVMETVAELVGDTYQLNGEKNYCSNAPVADVALVYAATDQEKGAMGGITGFILEKEKQQFSTGEAVEKMGLRSCLMSKVLLNDITCSPEAVLGKPGGGMRQFSESMTWERIGLSAIHMGTVQRLLEQTIAYAKERKLSGQAISKHQSIAHQLVEVKVQLEAARNLVYKAAWKLSEGKTANEAASIAKLYASEMYKKQTMHLLQIHGAIGYINNSDIERSIRDAAAATLYSGTSEIQKNIIARYLKL
ncbi:MAG: alkylation response protein AidB-like acyl-CoA dehydrogenase [Polaribacter sp.]|jgi:alkylation response protein AidB-like acyl-CoA dehydrogenase